MVRTLTTHQCVPGSIPEQCHTWVEFVVGSHHEFVVGSLISHHSHPCPEGFSSGPLPSTIPKSNSTRIEDPHENQLRLMWLPL